MIHDPKILNCPICKSNNIHYKFKINYSNTPFHIFKCNTCTFQFMNPPFSNKYLNQMYDQNYYLGNSDYSYVDERKIYKYSAYVWDARIKKIRSYVKSGEFLDIGSSFGGFISRASKYFNVYGIELSKYSSDYAINHYGFDIFNGSFMDYPTQENKFDVITMIELIEHLKNPTETIQKCKLLLKENGLLVIQTADMNAHQALNAGSNYHYYLPGHVSYFTEESLKLLLNNCGFKDIKIFRPVDFGLIPKLRKSRGSFKNLRDYFKWFKIISYHFKGYFRKNGKPLTSSMVVYAR